jgi:hypothetical protein
MTSAAKSEMMRVPMSSLAVTTVDLARLQFATTSLYHFLFVPLTLGLAPLVAVMQTLWYRGGDERWLRLTRFFGTLMLINFAIGVATGLVQEFQFGMNWSIYSEYVGDVFGAPLAIEGSRASCSSRRSSGSGSSAGTGSRARPPRDGLAVRHRKLGVGVLHHLGELLDAAARRLDGHRRPRRADGRLGALLEPLRDLGLHPRAARRAHDGVGRDLRRRLLALRPRPETRSSSGRRRSSR